MSSSAVRQAPFQPGVTYGSTPPASPTDGQFWIFPADATNGVNWQFRYNSGSASTYKWEFVGGPEAHNGTTGYGLTANGSWQEIPNASFPWYTLPRAGDYDVHFGVVQAWQASTAAGTFALGIGINHASPSAMYYALEFEDGLTVTQTVYSADRTVRLTGRSASDVLSFYAIGPNGDAIHFGQGLDMWIRPVRVS